MKNINVPVGISNFEKIRQDGYYYVDKTGLIKDMLKNKIPEVTLITRPRRFGKTLAMSMLASFFDIRRDSKKLFQGLNISKEQQLCNDWMNQYPTLFLSFKDVDGTIFENALGLLQFTIAELCKKHTYLIESDVVDQDDKETFRKLKSMGSNLPELQGSIIMLMNMMKAYYNKPVILLIDEYDVPIAKASSNGYYKEMLEVMKAMLSTALKDNEALKFAVVTGCLKIAKESVFTGTNNFVSDTISSERYNEYYGFTQKDVDQILQDAQIEEKASDIKEWYDGYRFGEFDVYCPWDVINHVDRLCDDSDIRPQTYWINSSGNSLVRRLINRADSSTKDEIERLIAGEAIEKVIRQDLTYDEIENSIDNIWSVLFTTGYLTKIGEVKLPDSESYAYMLVIPNKEVREVFVLQIQEWFKAVVANDNDTMSLLSKAILDKDETILARQLNIVMGRMISILDTKAPDDMKENFYHGLLLGLLRGSNPDWLIKSNRESGDGFSDILIKPENPDLGIVIEVKYAKEFKGLDAACDAAMAQIKQKRYDETLRDEGRCDILAYGIAFCRKRCKVAGEKIND